MSESPSQRRRRGRQAFYPGGDPAQHNPYHTPSHAADFNQGWGEAAERHAARAPIIAKEDQKWSDLAKLDEILSDENATAHEAQLAEILKRLIEGEYE